MMTPHRLAPLALVVGFGCDAVDMTPPDAGRSGDPAELDAGLEPPVAALACPVGATACGDSDPELIACDGLSFGTVSGEGPPCELVVEVRNEAGPGAADLLVEGVEILVRDLVSDLQVDESQVGFSVRGLGNSRPLVVPAGGARRLVLGFAGSTTGLFRGEPERQTGLRIYTSDPLQPVLTSAVTAIGAGSRIELTPRWLSFGPVAPGETARETVRVANIGEAPLEISSLRVASGNPEFVLTTSRGGTRDLQVARGESLELFVDYTPADVGPDVERIEVSSDAPESVTVIEVVAGVRGSILVEPSTVVVLPGSGAEETFTVRNQGTGPLSISGLDLVGPGADPSDPSLDDFEIDGCPSFPCRPGTALCAPAAAGCTQTSTTFTVRYDNNDLSSSDIAELRIESDDPLTPRVTLVLQGVAR